MSDPAISLSDGSLPAPTPEELLPSYADEAEGALGCEHYRRNCKLRCPHCHKFVPCRFCHDETESHTMNRFAVKEALCMKCGTIQPCTQYCKSEKCISNEEGPLARYFCPECVLYDNDPAKDIYHCPHCKLCRVGKGLGIDYFHCDKCRVCLSINMKDNHKCIENCLDSNCPVCLEWMFSSREPVLLTKCGHGMHKECFASYCQRHGTCPVCCKSLGDMTTTWARIDALLAGETHRPAWFARRESHITCNDCERRGTAPYHLIYHKCPHCGSYNTAVIEYRNIGPAEGDAPPAGGAWSISVHRMALVSMAVAACAMWWSSSV